MSKKYGIETSPGNYFRLLIGDKMKILKFDEADDAEIYAQDLELKNFKIKKNPK